MSSCVAVMNAGSSSIKFAIYQIKPEALLFRGKVEKIGISPHLEVADVGGTVVSERSWPANGLSHRGATEAVLVTAKSLLEGMPVAAVGHRVVHGGTRYTLPTLIDRSVMSELAELVPLAPLHQPHNLAAIEEIADSAPHIPQVACFDTAFHRSQPESAQLFGLPRDITELGIRRYGFHGLSYEYVTSRLPELAAELRSARVVIAHLGNGASLCAVRGGRSMATTMGFTAVDGLLMGTRCGSLDPGVLLYLMQSKGMDARDIERLIYRQSGLLGVSGISSDMRALRASCAPPAAEAIALFIYRVVREIGSLAAALGGVDALIFTGGIGENDSATRAEVADGCRWLDLTLDEARNARGVGRISADSSKVTAWVVPTDEERMIAKHTSTLLKL